MTTLRDQLFDTSVSFEEKAIQAYNHQRDKNEIYGKFCKALGVEKIHSVEEIPLLPIQAFKDSIVVTETSKFSTQHSTLFFQSSGTSGMARSRHYISEPEIYKESILKGMNHFYDLSDYVILAYTPGYNENPHSSLIWMLNTLIENDRTGLSQFLDIGKPLDPDLIRKINEISGQKRVILFGAAFGLLDMIEMGTPKLPDNSVILETGGMKTHRREMSKEYLHELLSDRFGIPKQNVHSEYGMTELLSQAYSQGSLWFETVPWMQVSIRDPKDPMRLMPNGEEGLIGVIDLANLYSCSFILTGDKGIQREDGKFKVLGRWNPRNLRGCNFLIDRD
jgi:hypothetical protein